jgi:hypothetical protein
MRELIALLTDEQKAALKLAFDAEECLLLETPNGAIIGVHVPDTVVGYTILQRYGYYAHLRRDERAKAETSQPVGSE